MNLTFSLYRLQTYDTQLLRIKKRIREIDQILQSDAEVAEALKARDEIKAEVDSIESELKLLSDQVHEKHIKAQLTHNALFDGKGRSLKELQDLQAEDKALKRAIEKLENDQLEVTARHDEALVALTVAENHYTETVNRRLAENSLILGEKSNLEAQIPGINSQRKALMNPLPADVIEEYQALFRAKHGRAVAAVDDEFCSACGIELKPSELQQVKSQSLLFKCKSCGRILYYP
ncbi:MAG TPA: C4-type zinc ribbon domain-containing protein [Anaerolineaceae bacterium]|nr:C4-type zinc ribbon domain-containing protein [Anaerolineaceae bacterium]